MRPVQGCREKSDRVKHISTVLNKNNNSLERCSGIT